MAGVQACSQWFAVKMTVAEQGLCLFLEVRESALLWSVRLKDQY